MVQVYFTILKNRVMSSYSSDLLDSDSFDCIRDYHGMIVFKNILWKSVLPVVSGSRYVSLDSIAKSRRVIRARSALQAGIARWKGVKNLKFMTLTISNELAQFSNIFVRGGINACWEAFIKRLRRVFGSIDYIKVSVSLAESSHIHVIFNGGWVSQRWISDIWEEISCCPVVDIRTLWYGRGLRNYLANYVQNQGRLGYSQNWVFRGWRFLSEKVFARLKNRYLPKWDASPYCANIFYRFVWYRRVLPFLVRCFNDWLLLRFALLKEPIFVGNWVPRCDGLFLYSRSNIVLFGGV